MATEISGLLDKYLSWLKSKTVVREVNGWAEVTTPYLDRHNDYLQIYIKQENDSFLLTDDGYVLNDLELSGAKINSPKREQLLRQDLTTTLTLLYLNRRKVPSAFSRQSIL